MRLEIRMPKLSEFSDVGAIAKWRVAVGDIVRQGDVVADVEVDLSTVELKARADGKIAEIWVHAGQAVPVETVIAMQTVEGEILSDQVDIAETEDIAQTEAVEDDPFSLDETMPDSPDELDAAPSARKKEAPVVQHGHVLASPAAILLAEQYNVNLGTLVGTGACGCIEREDVEAAMQTSSQFITVEDVDDLMNFDGDFSSPFSSGEPEASGTNEPEVEGATDEFTAEQDVPVEQTSTDAPVNEYEESVAEESSAEAAAEPDFEESSEEDAEALDEPDIDEPTDEDAEAQDEPDVDESSEEDAEAQDEPDVEESTDEVAEALDEPDVEESSEEDAAVLDEPNVEESSEEDAAALDEPDVEESSEEDAAALDEPDVDESYEEVAADSIDDFVYGQTSSAPEESLPDFVDTHEQPPAEELSEQQDEMIGEQVEPEESPAPDVIYMGEGAVQSVEVASVGLVDDGAETEDLVAEESDSTADDGSEYEATDGEAFDAGELAAGFSPEADHSDEPEALTIDESDTIAAETPGESSLAAEQDFSAAGISAEKWEEPALEQIEEPVDGKGQRKSVKIRRIVARKMQESWQNAPHFFVTVAVDMTDVIRFRTDLGVTINDFILAATSRALQEHPWVNSHFVNDEAVEQPEVNLSLAVETENGLFYPVLKNCGGKSLKDLGLAAAAMVLKAHSVKLTDEDMAGGSFTISNMGMLGVESFGAIITPPQVAVLAVGTVKGEVVVDEHEEMVMAPMVRLTLSADHRALDGADAADFLGTLKSYLEAPITLVATPER